MSKVTVVGACGRVGLPFSLLVAQEHDVIGIDNNLTSIVRLNTMKHMPFKENHAKDLIVKLGKRFPHFTNGRDSLKTDEIVVVMIGTPMDEEGNPRIDGILDFFHLWYKEFGTESFKDKLIILRSTVSPGTTEILKTKIETWTGLIEGTDFSFVFAPERVSEGNSIDETPVFPTLIGAFNDYSYNKAYNFFSTFVDKNSIKLSPREAELAKLMANMARYVNFALSNEYKIIADHHGCDINKIIESVNVDYPRANIPFPGPNVGGPCLTKDGVFLTQEIMGNGLIKAATDINEGMPAYIWAKIKSYDLKRVMILGSAFKANSDDTRLSLSFKMKKILESHGIEVSMYDPVISYESGNAELIDFNQDAFIVMTPHDMFIKSGIYDNICTSVKDAIFVDLWHHWFKEDIVRIKNDK